MPGQARTRAHGVGPVRGGRPAGRPRKHITPRGRKGILAICNYRCFWMVGLPRFLFLLYSCFLFSGNHFSLDLLFLSFYRFRAKPAFPYGMRGSQVGWGPKVSGIGCGWKKSFFLLMGAFGFASQVQKINWTYWFFKPVLTVPSII